ncbi:hypothetical protein QQM79_03315 [Marinobacteraceae bacterium S3BR75-40.1]
MKATFQQAWTLYRQHLLTLAVLTGLFFGLEKAIQFGGLQGAPQGGAALLLALIAFLALPAWMDVAVIRYLMGLTGRAAPLSPWQCLQVPAQPLLHTIFLNALVLLPFAILASLQSLVGLLALPILARLSFAGFEIVCRGKVVSDALANSWRDSRRYWTVITGVLIGAYLATHLLLAVVTGVSGAETEGPVIALVDYLVRVVMVYVTVWLYRLYTL